MQDFSERTMSGEAAWGWALCGDAAEVRVIKANPSMVPVEDTAGMETGSADDARFFCLPLLAS